MENLFVEEKPTSITIELKGQIDSSNAADVETQIKNAIQGKKKRIIFDAQDLNYISSAGLRVLLRVKKSFPDFSIINVNSEIYEILDMTGFAQLMDVKKAYRIVSIDGCEVIGQGANGTVYRLDNDNVIKVYKDADALDDIQNERELARLALVLGIPTAISYDVVRVNDTYGSVFELLNATSFSKILANEPERIDWVVQEYVQLLQKIHSTVVPEGKLPEIKQIYIDYVHFLEDYLDKESFTKLLTMVENIPDDRHMIHGDYHTKNVELTDNEVLLIDMDTLATGHPIFELASMFNAYIGFSEYDKTTIEHFQGFSFELSKEFWDKTLRAYLGVEDETYIKDVENKARILGYTRLIRRSIRRDGLNNAKSKAEIDLWTKELLELLSQYQSLSF